MTEPITPDHEHRWQWGSDHGDGTYSHGPCLVKGCAVGSEDRIRPAAHHHVNPDADPATTDYGYTHAHTHEGPHKHDESHEYRPGDTADGSVPYIFGDVS